MTNPTEQYREAVTSALEAYSNWLSYENGGWHGDVYSDRLPYSDELAEAEALASIQASTVSLLEGLKKEAYADLAVGDAVRVEDIDQLIKDLSNGQK